MEEKHCDTCMHETLPSGIAPCSNCIAHDEWKPKGAAPAVGIDPGAPEGDRTNVRRVWPLDGREIGPVDITSASQLKEGHLVETARAVVKQITRLDYAIAGVRSRIGSIGIRFTDKDLSRDEIGFMTGQLNALQVDLFELEEEREAMEHVKDRDS